MRLERVLNIKLFLGISFALLFIYSLPAHAQDVNDVVDNIGESAEGLPGLISPMLYIIGILLGILGVIKLKEHVENPNQVKLSVPVIRLIAGGALFAIPTVYEAVQNTIGVSALDVENGTSSSFAFGLSSMVAAISAASFGVLQDLNALTNSALESIKRVPYLISVVSYLLGLMITAIGVLKIKDHVENPEQVQIKEGVVRLLTGGALLAMPTIYNAMFELFDGAGGSIVSAIGSAMAALGFLYSSYAGTICDPTGSTIGAVGAALGMTSSGPTFGDMICGLVLHSAALPIFLSSISYILGLALGVWGILKLRDHALNPTQVNLWEGMSRLIAGGAFFALPVVVEVIRNSVGSSLMSVTTMALPRTGGGMAATLGSMIGAIGAAIGMGGGGGGTPCSSGNISLDCMLVLFTDDILASVHVALNFFTFCAGSILIMIGISRLIKSAQDGPRGPGGIGTIITFVVGGALLSYNELMVAFTSTFTGMPVSLGQATLAYSTGMGADELGKANLVIVAIMNFVLIIGLVSFVRGFFIIRGVAEGNQQASIMAGITHIVAGTLAVNLGSLINAIQTTLGIASYGITFS